MRCASARSIVPLRIPRARTVTSFGPVHATSAPSEETISRNVSTSRIRGTFSSVIGSLVSAAAARHGSAAFLGELVPAAA